MAGSLKRDERQKNSVLMLRSANSPDSEKSQAARDALDHLDKARQERSFYQQCCAESRASLPADITTLSQEKRSACSFSGIAHYSFDFAQQVHYPSNPLQPGSIFFKTPRKCGLFGVACEALPCQVNFLLEECVSTGKGVNCVVSLLHFFFENYGLGEEHVQLHADNCSGQNKNNCMWRVLTGRHMSIKLSFLLTGHTKFSCDWLFGLVKRRFKVTKVDCLEDIARVVNESATCNVAQLCGTEQGDVLVPMYDWASF
ncbi:hypothetical protein RRG08_035704 [Elysia crispata]|uniref:DUF7869 domain-containing protein n=1 Tax=Elysia crispata TaxID=231223 RepID=A0AAE1D044_9GAST|nr:hypothetical protein RRG08_035704 [Elysia crispata]